MNEIDNEYGEKEEEGKKGWKMMNDEEKKRYAYDIKEKIKGKNFV
jgi:hypothetical protein